MMSDKAMEKAAQIAECAFDDRPNSRAGHHSEMDWTDGYREGTQAAAAAIRNALPVSDGAGRGEAWRDMADAPRDGTYLLLKFDGPFDDAECPGVAVGKAIDTDCGWWLTGIWAASTAHHAPVGWQPLPGSLAPTTHPQSAAVEALEALRRDFRSRAHTCRTNPDAFCTKSAAVWDFAAQAVEEKL